MIPTDERPVLKQETVERILNWKDHQTERIWVPYDWRQRARTNGTSHTLAGATVTTSRGNQTESGDQSGKDSQ